MAHTGLDQPALIPAAGGDVQAVAARDALQQQALTQYKVCKDGTIAVPPAKCPEEERGYINITPI